MKKNVKSYTQKDVDQGNSKSRWSFKRRLLTYLVIGFSVSIFYAIWKASSYQTINTGFQPPEMSLAQYSSKDVVGDLGGMKVVIPRYFAEYVEYEGDPGFGEKREGKRPERTFDSRLESFGMDVRFPDMKGLENSQIRKEKRLQPLRESSWLRVGVSAGSAYKGEGTLDRLSIVVLNPEEYPGDYWWNNYVRDSEDKHGLELYVVDGMDPDGRPAKENYQTSDVYLYRKPNGKVETHIRCRRAKTSKGVARCRMRFDLEPKVKAVIRVAFRKGLLSEWRTIKKSVTNLVMSFEYKREKEDIVTNSNF